MKTEQPIEGIYVLRNFTSMPNGDVLPPNTVLVETWGRSIIVLPEDFGGVEKVDPAILASAHIGTNGDEKLYIFSPTNLIEFTGRPDCQELAEAEVRHGPTLH